MTMSSADRLVAKSLMMRAADARDGRAQTLALTDRGVALVPDLATLADRNDAEFFASLATDERETLLRLLRKMAERGQMTLPKAVRDALGLTKGSVLKVELDGSRIVLRKSVDDAISRVRGKFALEGGKADGNKGAPSA